MFTNCIFCFGKLMDDVSGIVWNRFGKVDMVTKGTGDYLGQSGNAWSNKFLSYGMSVSYDRNGNILRLGKSYGSGVERVVKDSLMYAYGYKDISYSKGEETVVDSMLVDNRLYGLSDELNNTDANYILNVNRTPQVDNMVDGLSATLEKENDYGYNGSGSLVRDAGDDVSNIVWNRFGKVDMVTKGTGDYLKFGYDMFGNRVLLVLCIMLGIYREIRLGCMIWRRRLVREMRICCFCRVL